MHKVFETQRRVEFCETDAAGIAHFSSFLCYMEQAEHEFLRSLGVSVIQPMSDGGHLSWPRVKVECNYAQPARFEEVLKILVQIGRLGTKSVTYQFTFCSSADNLVARGEVVAVCCRVRNHGESIESMEIPQHLRTSMSQYLKEQAE